jgi:7-cyano-7-deazaguanine reductase
MMLVNYPINFTERDIENIVSTESSTDYEDVIKYAPYIEQGLAPKLKPLGTRLPNTVASFRTEEFSTFCKAVQMPDYVDDLTITIISKDSTVEMKSLRDYLISFRDKDIYQEEVIGVILIDIVRAIDPQLVQIIANFKPRGGATTQVVFTYKHSRYILPMLYQNQE